MDSSTTCRDLIEHLRTFPQRLAALVEGLTAEQLTTHYLPHEWTVAQNIHHLIDSHMHSIVRMKLMLTEERPTFRVYDQDRWADLPDGTGAEIANSLALLAHLHQRWADLLTNLPDEAWQRVGVHPESGETTLAAMLRTYVQHGDGHIGQITRTLAAGNIFVHER
ncbi:MAG: DUF664 domain-containing protein [Chloroflexaceae bacterium]|nr:DUF664 domain-containing protein [Chloroflexaceae bacterium]